MGLQQHEEFQSSVVLDGKRGVGFFDVAVAAALALF